MCSQIKIKEQGHNQMGDICRMTESTEVLGLLEQLFFAKFSFALNGICMQISQTLVLMKNVQRKSRQEMNIYWKNFFVQRLKRCSS